MKVPFRDLSVFTRNGAGGNPLAVIDFDSVPSARWQEVASAIGYSETVFVEAGETATVHIYTPARRIPFAGHPLVGTAFALGSGTEVLRYDSGHGAVAHDSGEVFVTVERPGPAYETAAPSFGVQAAIVELPLPYLVVETRDVATLSRLEAEDLADLGEVYVWTWEETGRVVRSRFFATELGVGEDPATGSAAVALARTMADQSGSVLVHQGEEMGSPSTIKLAWEGSLVSIGGAVADHGVSSVDID